jgi:hypothetical protein
MMTPMQPSIASCARTFTTHQLAHPPLKGFTHCSCLSSEPAKFATCVPEGNFWLVRSSLGTKVPGISKELGRKTHLKRRSKGDYAALCCAVLRVPYLLFLRCGACVETDGIRVDHQARSRAATRWGGPGPWLPPMRNGSVNVRLPRALPIAARTMMRCALPNSEPVFKNLGFKFVSSGSG